MIINFFSVNSFHSADADCTESIIRDKKYVKAYYRRALARIELERFEDAKNDLEKILELEPSNKEAAFKLKGIRGKIKPSKVKKFFFFIFCLVNEF